MQFFSENTQVLNLENKQIKKRLKITSLGIKSLIYNDRLFFKPHEKPKYLFSFQICLY